MIPLINYIFFKIYFVLNYNKYFTNINKFVNVKKIIKISKITMKKYYTT